jgi:hypothetical protein
MIPHHENIFYPERKFPRISPQVPSSDPGVGSLAIRSALLQRERERVDDSIFIVTNIIV